MKRLFLFMIVALSAALLFTGCKKDNPVPPVEFTVTFNPQGGSEVSAQKVEENRKISKPTDPTKGDFIFAGWFKEATWVNAWNFEQDVVTKNITLYAKWTTVTHTVTFNTNGGSAVAPLTVAKGATAMKPLPPSKTNAAFDNWYQEATLINVYDFNTAVNSDITLYAKWITVTHESLLALVDQAMAIKNEKYTRESVEVMLSKLEAAQLVLDSGSATPQQIAAAYLELSAAINGLVARPHRAVTDIVISALLDGVRYVSPGTHFNLYAYASDAVGNTATDKRVTFTYDAAKLEAWVESGFSVDETRISFLAKAVLTQGETVSVIVKSAENPAISKTFTLKVAGGIEIKTMFLNAVNALPNTENIAYEHYDAIMSAFDMYHNLSGLDYGNPAVQAAYKKLRLDEEAYHKLPQRIKYSFKGNICTLSAIYGVANEEVVGEFTFAANGAFPVGTYTQNSWSPWDDGTYHQNRFALMADGTVLMENRAAKDAAGTNPTVWVKQNSGTYTNQGTQANGGMFVISIKGQEVVPPAKAVRSQALLALRMPFSK